jgi:hypothetical protein
MADWRVILVLLGLGAPEHKLELRFRVVGHRDRVVGNRGEYSGNAVE